MRKARSRTAYVSGLESPGLRPGEKETRLRIIPFVFRSCGVAADTVKDGTVRGDAESPSQRDIRLDPAEIDDMIRARTAHRMDVLQLAEHPHEPRAMPVEAELPTGTAARPEVVRAGSEAGSRRIDGAKHHRVDENGSAERIATRADRPARVHANLDALPADALRRILEVVIARIHGQHVPA